MATKVVKGGPGILSNIGNLASLAGMATGQPWLTALGAGAKLTDGMINGFGDNGTSGAEDVLGKLKEAMDGWKNPASGNIARTAGKTASAANSVNPAMSYEELASRWSPSRQPYSQWF